MKEKSFQTNLADDRVTTPQLRLVHAAAIAACYIVLTLLFQPISFGPVPFRISEALCLLPYFEPASADRCSRVQTFKEEPVPCVAPSDPLQYPHHSVGVEICVRS